MAGELVETCRLWARQNAAIQPEWAERLGAHLVKRTYSEPHWSQEARRGDGPRAGHAVRRPAGRRPARAATARSTRRWPASCSSGTPWCSGEWRTRHRFFAENRALLEEAEELEHRARRRDIVVDEHTLFDFYDARVGADVVSGAHFDQWWKQARQQQPDLLTFDPEMLTHDTAERGARGATSRRSWRQRRAGLTFPISYHFEPGAADDGLTIDVPVATLNRVDGRRLLLARPRACARSWSPS